MKTITIKSTSEKEIKSAIQKNWNLYDRYCVDSSEVTGLQLVNIIQSLGLDSKFVVCVVCDNKPELWRSKRAAMDFYKYGMLGADKLRDSMRYSKIWYKLSNGYKLATDQWI